MGRFENSMRNLFAAWGGQAVSVLFTFVTRSVFAYQLSMEYLGVENLFSNVLTILSLADLGVGSAITFALYKPIAENDTELVKSLMRLFKRAYIIIGCAIAIVGLVLAPFVGYLIEDAPDIPDLSLYFLFFVLNTAVSYFFSYKGSLIYAYQKNYIVSLIQYGFQIAMCIVQIVLIFAFHSYILFLACMLLSTLGQNLMIARTADNMFPYLRDRGAAPLSRAMLVDIAKNTAALLMHRVAGAASTPASSVIVSAFVGIKAISIYGSYLLVLNSLQKIMVKVFDAIQASVGNMGVTEDVGRQYQVFRESLFVNAALYATVYAAVLCCMDAFVGLWLGEQYVFPDLTCVLMVGWYFALGMRACVQAFTGAYGLYWKSWYKAVAETVFLLGSSLVLVRVLGINGVALSGLLSALVISTPIEAYVLFRHGFHLPVKLFYRQAAGYYVVAVGAGAASFLLCQLIGLGGIAAIVVNAAVAIAVCVVLFSVFFGRTDEFKQSLTLVKRAASMVVRRARKS